MPVVKRKPAGRGGKRGGVPPKRGDGSEGSGRGGVPSKNERAKPRGWLRMPMDDALFDSEVENLEPGDSLEIVVTDSQREVRGRAVGVVAAVCAELSGGGVVLVAAG